MQLPPSIKRKLESLNAERTPRIQTVLEKLCLAAKIDYPTVHEHVQTFLRLSDPYELDLGFTFANSKDAVLEIGYNPHVYLSTNVFRRAEALARKLKYKGVKDFLSSAPFYSTSLTIELEWKPKHEHKPKLALLMEDLPRHMRDHERHQTLRTLSERFGVPYNAIAKFDRPELDIITADFGSTSKALRLFLPLKFYESNLPPTAQQFYQILEASGLKGRKIFYQKFNAEKIEQEKFYFTPESPQPAVRAVKALLDRFAPSHHPNTELLNFAQSLATANGLEFTPVCLSIALTPTGKTKYLALYFAIGGIPYEFIP